MRTFTNADGREFQVSGIPPFAEKLLLSTVKNEMIAAGVELLPCPVYSFATLGGKVVEKEHNQGTIKSDKTTDLEREQWDEYQKQQDEIVNLLFQKRIRLAVTCLNVNPLEDKQWLSKMKMIGIPIPDDQGELMDMYASTEVFRDVNDAFVLLAEAQVASRSISEEVAEAAINTFRAGIQRRPAAGSNL